jgi:hypothetical protein
MVQKGLALGEGSQRASSDADQKNDGFLRVKEQLWDLLGLPQLAVVGHTARGSVVRCINLKVKSSTGL